MQALEEQEKNPPKISTWQHFFIHEVLGEIPLIGSVCRHEKHHDILYDVGRSVSVLTVGTVIMMANILDIQSGDSMALNGVKTAVTMGVGMASGSIAYNVAGLFVRTMQQSCQENSSMKQNLLTMNKE